MRFRIYAILATMLLGSWILTDMAQAQPLRIEITEGVVEPMPLALPGFVAQNAAAVPYADELQRIIAADLLGTGLFRLIAPEAHIARITSFDAPVSFADWRAISAQALITAELRLETDGRVAVKFRVWDVFAGQELGQGMQLVSSLEGRRRLAHKIADQVYSRLTGESAYFDSRVVYVSETGPKDAREKRLAIMDQDGANIQYLTDGKALVLAPRFSPDGTQVLYTSYETGAPRVHILSVGQANSRILQAGEGVMSFAPRFSPDGGRVIYSLTQGSNTDIWSMDLISGAVTRLTSGRAIETAPDFSPDGSQIVYESDESGSQQLYIMPATGGEGRRISFGKGRYGTPVWSPRGDMIAFTKQHAGRFHIGVMRVDGSNERLLTASFLDEGPTWSPNGRVLMFARETRGAQGASALYTVDVSGRNLRRVRTPAGGSDPSWGPLQ